MPGETNGQRLGVCSRTNCTHVYVGTSRDWRRAYAARAAAIPSPSIVIGQTQGPQQCNGLKVSNSLRQSESHEPRHLMDNLSSHPTSADRIIYQRNSAGRDRIIERKLHDATTKQAVGQRAA